MHPIMLKTTFSGDWLPERIHRLRRKCSWSCMIAGTYKNHLLQHHYKEKCRGKESRTLIPISTHSQEQIFCKGAQPFRKVDSHTHEQSRWSPHGAPAAKGATCSSSPFERERE
eukprot:c47419_g1_i1 orf=731-1069(+)